MIWLLTSLALAETTKIETMTAASGVAVVLSCKEVGKIDDGGGDVGAIVRACRVSDSAGHTLTGAQIEAENAQSRQILAFVDLEEIQPLISGLQYIISVNTTSVPFPTWNGNYSTADLHISYTYYGSGRIVFLASDGVGKFLPPNSLDTLRKLLEQVKVELAAIK